MKIIKTVLLIFSVSLAQANDLKDDTTSKREPQVLRLESLFLACSPSRLKNTEYNFYFAVYLRICAPFQIRLLHLTPYLKTEKVSDKLK